MRYAASFALAAGLLCVAGAAAAQDHPHGRQFLDTAIKGDNSEITLGRLAERKGASAGVRSFGHTLVQDHSRAKAQAVQVAHRLHYTVPTGMVDQARDEQQKLDGLSGQAFDREFVDYMVKDHQNDIADFEAEANATDPAPLVHLAKQSLPVLRKHLRIAETLQKSGK